VGGDVSPLLRADYKTIYAKTEVRIEGKMGKLRARVPFSRPKRYSLWRNQSSPDGQKTEAYQKLVRRREQECHNWFAKNFAGRFAAAGLDSRPTSRVLFTALAKPFGRETIAFEATDLAYAFAPWSSQDPANWYLSPSPRSAPKRTTVFAARRNDVANSEHLPDGEDAASLWYLMQRFGDEQLDLTIRIDLHNLLSLYSEQVSRIRDQAGMKRRLRRPVKKANELDRFIVGDGLDIATVGRDLEEFSTSPHFWRDVPEYQEDYSAFPENFKSRYPARSLKEAYSGQIGDLAKRVVQDAEITLGNVRASAELQQSVSNTKLQWTMSVLTVVAIVVAVIGLYHH
jgi:hypothetical protein